MDKTKAKLKARRREERRKQKHAERKQLVDSFRASFKAEGLPVKANDKELIAAYNEVQRDIAMESVMIDTIAVLYVMHRDYGYGAKRLHRLAGEIAVIITEVGNGRRSLEDLKDILKGDARLNLDALHYTDRCNKKGLLLKSALLTLPIQLTAVFYTLFPLGSVRHISKRLVSITANSWWLAKHMIHNGNSEDYRIELEKTGLTISADGKFGSNKLSIEENSAIKRRIKA